MSIQEVNQKIDALTDEQIQNREKLKEFFTTELIKAMNMIIPGKEAGESWNDCVEKTHDNLVNFFDEEGLGVE